MFFSKWSGDFSNWFRSNRLLRNSKKNFNRYTFLCWRILNYRYKTSNWVYIHVLCEHTVDIFFYIDRNSFFVKKNMKTLDICHKHFLRLKRLYVVAKWHKYKICGIRIPYSKYPMKVRSKSSNPDPISSCLSGAVMPDSDKIVADYQRLLNTRQQTRPTIIVLGDEVDITVRSKQGEKCIS